MQCNVKAKLKYKEDQTQLACYGIVYGSCLQRTMPKYIKRKKTIDGLLHAILVEFDRILREETYNNEDAIASAVYNFKRVIDDLELNEIVHYDRILRLLRMNDPKLREMYMTMLLLLTICYYNVVDQFVKSERTQKRIVKDLTRAYIGQCRSGIIKAHGDGRLFAKMITEKAGYTVD